MGRKNGTDNMMDRFLNFKFDREMVKEWLRLIKDLSGIEDDLSTALTFAVHKAKTDEEKRIVHTVTELLRREMSGQIIPPLHLGRMYRELTDRKEK